MGEKTLGNRWLRLGAVAWGVMSGAFGILLLAIPWWLAGRFQLLWLLSATSAVIASLPALKSLRTGRLHRAVGSVVVGSLLTFVPLFHSILPTLDALWLSRGIADAIGHHSDLAGKAPQVVAAGYHEPSLVFLLGTDTKLLSAEMAACYLREIPQAVAVVSEEVEAESFADTGQLTNGGPSSGYHSWIELYQGLTANHQDLRGERSPWPIRAEQSGAHWCCRYPC